MTIMSKIVNSELTVDQVRKIIAERQQQNQAATTAVEVAEQSQRLEQLQANFQRVSAELDRANASLVQLQESSQHTRAAQEALARSVRSHRRTLTLGAFAVVLVAVSFAWQAGRQTGLFRGPAFAWLERPIQQLQDMPEIDLPWWHSNTPTQETQPVALVQPQAVDSTAQDWQQAMERGHQMPAAVPEISASEDAAFVLPDPVSVLSQSTRSMELFAPEPASALPLQLTLIQPSAGDGIRPAHVQWWEKPLSNEPQPIKDAAPDALKDSASTWQLASSTRQTGQWLRLIGAQEGEFEPGKSEVALSPSPTAQPLSAPVAELLATGEETLKWLRQLSIRNDASLESRIASDSAEDPETWWHNFLSSHEGAQWWTSVDIDQPQINPVVFLWSEESSPVSAPLKQ